MTITVKAAREALEAATELYVHCDHQEVAEAARKLQVARIEYACACTKLVEKLPNLLIGNSYNRDSLNHVYREITGENMP